MADRIKVAVMGFENGHCYSHYRGLRKNPLFEVVAVSFAPRTRIAYELRLGRDAFDGLDIYYDDEQMLRAHPEIQVCVCGGANSRHLEQFRLCAERGIHVVSMKAPTYDMDEYDEMIRLQKKHDILVYIELEMRWRATVERLREIVASGTLGEVQSFVAFNYSHFPLWYRWVDVPEESYGKRLPIREGTRTFRGGALTDHPHIFDLIRYIFGCDFDTVYAEAAPNMRMTAETEDLVYVIGRMQNGVVFSLDPSYANREPDQTHIIGDNYSLYPRPVQVEIQISGTKGTLYANAYGADCVENLAPDTMKYMVEDEGLALDTGSSICVYKKIFDDLHNGTDSSHIPLAEHKKTMMAQNAAYDSIYRGQPVKLEY